MPNIEAEIEKRFFETAYWISRNQINLSWPSLPFFVKQRPKIHFYYMSHKCRVGENDVEFRKKIWRLPFSWSVFRWLNSPLFYIQCFSRIEREQTMGEQIERLDYRWWSTELVFVLFCEIYQCIISWLSVIVSTEGAPVVKTVQGISPITHQPIQHFAQKLISPFQ